MSNSALDGSVVEQYRLHFQKEAYRRLGDKELAEDVSQIVITDWCKKGHLDEPHLGIWLRTVFKNKVTDALRARSRKSVVMKTLAVQVSDPARPQSVREATRRQEAIQAVREFIDRLREPGRSYMRLRLQGYTCREIGEKLGISFSTVNKTQALYLVLLRDFLSEDQRAELRSGRDES